MSSSAETAAAGPATEERLAAVKQFLLARKPGLGDNIDLDLDLIETRVIDSLGFLDFVFFLEQLTGRELETDAESVKVFRTLRSLRDHVLAAPPAGATAPPAGTGG
jgi:acyl carrier protein